MASQERFSWKTGTKTGATAIRFGLAGAALIGPVAGLIVALSAPTVLGMGEVVSASQSRPGQPLAFDVDRGQRNAPPSLFARARDYTALLAPGGISI